MFESFLVVVKMLVKAVGSRAEVKVAKKLNLEEVVAVVLVLLDMENNLLMMEEEKGRPYLQLVCQTHPLGSSSLISPIWFSIKVPR